MKTTPNIPIIYNKSNLALFFFVILIHYLFNYQTAMKVHLSFVFLCLTIILSSCSKNRGCKDPNAINYSAEAEAPNNSCIFPLVNLSINLSWGNEPFEVNRIYNLQGYNTAIKNFQCFLSDFTITNANQESQTIAPDFHLLSIINPKTAPTEVFASDIQRLNFLVGLNRNFNHRAVSLVNSTPPMFWNPTDGHIFLKIQGKVDRNGDGIPNENEGFNFEIGTDDLLQNITLYLNRKLTKREETIAINFDVKRLFDNIDLQTEQNTQTTDDLPLATKMANNIQQAVSY